jgi:hypothetical protein
MSAMLRRTEGTANARTAMKTIPATELSTPASTPSSMRTLSPALTRACIGSMTPTASAATRYSAVAKRDRRGLEARVTVMSVP